MITDWMRGSSFVLMPTVLTRSGWTEAILELATNGRRIGEEYKSTCLEIRFREETRARINYKYTRIISKKKDIFQNLNILIFISEYTKYKSITTVQVYMVVSQNIKEVKMALFSKLFGSSQPKDTKYSTIEKVEALIKQLKEQNNLGYTFSDELSLKEESEAYCELDSKSNSCFVLALVYMYGVNMKSDIKKAEKLFSKFLKKKHPLSGKAFYYLSILEGDTYNDKLKEATYLEKAHELGCLKATTEMALYYATGTGFFPKNKNEARRLWQIAIDKGNYSMQKNIDLLDKGF